jgi:acyl carrier protein
MSTRADVRQTVVDFLTRAGKLPGGPAGDVSLAADGAGLDSLEIAELSVALQDAHGSDPFTSGRMPRTIDEVVDFYES